MPLIEGVMSDFPVSVFLLHDKQFFETILLCLVIGVESNRAFGGGTDNRVLIFNHLNFTYGKFKIQPDCLKCVLEILFYRFVSFSDRRARGKNKPMLRIKSGNLSRGSCL